MSGRWPWLLLGVSACTPLDQLAIDSRSWPEEVRYLAVIAFDNGGGWLGSSGLISREERVEVAFRAEAAAAQLVVYGYQAAPIDELQPPPEGERRQALLRLAGNEDTTLPTPIFVGAFSPEGQSQPVTPAPLSVTAAWVPRCPQLAGPESRAELRCFGCGTAVRQLGCTLELEASNCTLGATGQVKEGQVTFEASAPFGTCTIEDQAGRRALDCPGSGACRIELHEPSPPTFVTNSVTLVSGPFTSSRSRIGLDATPQGYLLDLELLPSGLLVAEAGGTGTDWRCADDPSRDTPGRLHWLDPELGPIRSATTPPCLTQILPGQDGGVLLMAGAGAQTLIALGPDGKERRRLELPELAPGRFWASDLIRIAADRVALLMVGPNLEERTSLWVIDEPTLLPARSPIPMHFRARLLFAEGPGLVGAVIPDDNAIVLADVIAEVVGPYRKLDCYILAGAGISAVAKDGDRLWLSSRLPASRLFSVDGREFLCESVGAWADELQLDGVAVDPEGAAGWVGASQSDPAETAWLLPLDRSGKRILGGGTEVGRGPLSHLRSRGEVVYGLLPGAGQVVRATRAP